MTTTTISANDLTSTPREIWIGYDAPTAEQIMDSGDYAEFAERCAGAINEILATRNDVDWTDDEQRQVAVSDAMCAYDPEWIAVQVSSGQ